MISENKVSQRRGCCDTLVSQYVLRTVLCMGSFAAAWVCYSPDKRLGERSFPFLFRKVRLARVGGGEAHRGEPPGDMVEWSQQRGKAEAGNGGRSLPAVQHHARWVNRTYW